MKTNKIKLEKTRSYFRVSILPRRCAGVILVIFSILLTGCLRGKKVPNLDVIFAEAKNYTGKRPVIIIPGILGSKLEDPVTKESAWFNTSLIKGDNLSLPISPDLTNSRDTLVAKSILETARVFALFPEVSVYQSLIRAMEQYGGYTPGSWEDPGSEGARDKYYVFAYDWRLDNVENARLLTERVEQLKQKLNNPDLRFNIIAHSMGGLIVRYAAMYGKTDLPASGEKPVPSWAGANHFNKVFMFGTPNEGSMSALEVIIRGYSVGGFDIDVLNPEVIITSPAIFQLLPHQNTVKFYDEDLEPLKVDLFDPETWKKYNWSAYTSQIFLNKFAGQPAAADAKGRKSEFADISLDDLDAYFAAVLKRADAFHQALDADTSVPASISFFAFGSDCEETLDGAVIYKDSKTDAWRTLFSPRSFRNSSGKKITKSAIRKKIFAPGDYRVTRRSLLAETITQQNYRNSIFRRTLPVTATLLCEAHDELPNSKIMQDNFLTALISEIMQ